MSDEHRDVLGHLEKSAKEFLAATRDALDIADEVISERLKFLGSWFAGPGGGAGKTDPPKVEKIDVEPDGPAG